LLSQDRAISVNALVTSVNVTNGPACAVAFLIDTAAA